MHVLFCGDGSEGLSNASALAGILVSGGISYGYLPSNENLPRNAVHSWKLLVLSNFPSRQISEQRQLQIVERIKAGAGLLMIGGARSFHGTGGYWNETPLGNVLPVRIQGFDDTMTSSQPLAVAPAIKHPILDGLPWDELVPEVSGLNRVKCKPDDDLLLKAVSAVNCRSEESDEADGGNDHPLLAVGNRGRGRVAAWMSDFGPRWGGDFLRWGTSSRMLATHRVPGSRTNELMPGTQVGDSFAEFVTQLVLWTMGRL